MKLRITPLICMIVSLTALSGPARGGETGARTPALHPAAGAPPACVRAHGARGNGVDDDTEAIEAAVRAAVDGSGIVSFPRGVYRISRGIYLTSALRITGAPGAVIQKVPAVTQAVTQTVEAGDTTVHVADVEGFRVGQDFYLWDGEGSSFTGTVGRILEIDADAKRIVFEAYKSEGARRAYPLEKAPVFSSTFSMLTTNSERNPAVNLTIEGLILDAQAQPDEPSGYPLSPIHIDPPRAGRDQRQIFIRHNHVMNSASDGISVQAAGEVTIEHNRVSDCRAHGIHVGFTIDRVAVNDNFIENCGASAIYWCYGINEMIVTRNFIRNCRIGCGGIDGYSQNSVIAHNSFNGANTGIQMSGSGGSRTVIQGNVFQNGKGQDIDVYVSRFVTIGENTFSQGRHEGISVRGSSFVSVVNNQFYDFAGDYAIRLWRQPGGPQRRATDSRIAGNIIKGGNRAAISLEDADRIILSENIIHPNDNATAIRIADSCTEIVLLNNRSATGAIDSTTP